MQMTKRILVYILGLFVMSIGVCLSINSGLGVSPVNSLPYVLHSVFQIPLGICITAVFSLFIFLQFLLLRRAFKPFELIQLAFGLVFSYFMNFFSPLLAPLSFSSYPGQLLLMAVGIVLVSMGLFLYLQPAIIPMPMEGLTLALTKKLNKPFRLVKIAVDLASVGTGVVICLFAGQLYGIREGTLICALCIGPVTGFFTSKLGPAVQAFCFGPKKAQEPASDATVTIPDEQSAA